MVVGFTFTGLRRRGSGPINELPVNLTAEEKMMPRNRKWFHGMMAFPQPVELIGKGGTEAYHAGDELVGRAEGARRAQWPDAHAPR